MAGALNVDISPLVKPDIVHDLNVLPWPFPDSQFETAVMEDSIEHLKDVVSTMEELHRVCKNGALVRITTPHFSCANTFTDPTHLHHLGYFSFHYFTGEDNFASLSQRRFRHRSIRLIFAPSLLNKIVWRLANRFPRAYERRWAWLFPAWFLSFELEVVK
jgi:SAM-dependent methyltransferase